MKRSEKEKNIIFEVQKRIAGKTSISTDNIIPCLPEGLASSAPHGAPSLPPRYSFSCNKEGPFNNCVKHNVKLEEKGTQFWLD